MSNDGLYIGVATANGNVKILNSRTLEDECENKPHNLPVTGLSFAYYGKLLLSGSADYSYCYLPN